ncbi:MAG: response regulator transcription factor [Phycisphaerae bacterium]|nr:response regulator transcription factor [Phycisphaerae bacterium]
MSIKVLVADDHTMLRGGLSRCLRSQQDMEVIAEAANGVSAVELAKKRRPDVVIMDVSMPNLNGIDATRQIVQELPETRVIALSIHRTPSFVADMFKAGASGYVPKSCGLDELLEAVRTVASGRKYISPSIKDVSLDKTGQRVSVFSALTPRERQILHLLADGLATKEIARDLRISPKTVETHRLNITRKLGIDSVAELTRYAIRQGLTTPDPKQ